MILIDTGRLKFLLAGRDIQLQIQADRRVWHRNNTYAVGVHHNKTICRAQILHVDSAHADETGQITLTIRHAQQDDLRLLGKTGGYVTNTIVALPEEPEAVDERAQDKLSSLADRRWRDLTSDPLRRQRDDLARVLAEMRDHLDRHPNRDIAKTVRALEHQVRSLDRKLAA